MKVNIYQLIEGAKAARGSTVIIDVFRAFSVESCFFACGAKTILPVGGVDEAFRLKAEHPDYILAGERRGAILPGFDCGNSPAAVMRLGAGDQLSAGSKSGTAGIPGFGNTGSGSTGTGSTGTGNSGTGGIGTEKNGAAGRTVVHTTSAGTQGIANASHADEILGACLMNARATAAYLKSRAPKEVSLVCMGLEAKAPTEEDTLCAEYIRELLLGAGPEGPLDLPAEIEKLRHTSGAKFFDPAQQNVFPEEDFHLCVQVDRFPFAMRLDENGRMQKIDVL